MKNILLSALCLILAACTSSSDNVSGGSGGNRPGGGGGAEIVYPTFPTTPVTADNVRELFAPNFSGIIAGWQGDKASSLSISDDITITIDYSNSSDPFGGVATLGVADFKHLHGPDNQSFYIAGTSHQNAPSGITEVWLIGETSSGKHLIDITGRTTVVEHTVVLGGKPLRLQYADFGIWVIRERIDGPIHSLTSGDSINGYIYDNVRPFARGTGAGVWTEFGPGMQGVQTFTGSTVAAASNGLTTGDEVRSQIVYGTATLTLNPTDSGSGDGKLILDFPDFYKFTFSNVLPSGYGFGSDFQYVSAEDRGNKTGIIFDPNRLHNGILYGNLYGPVFGNPTEAIGDFIVENNGSRAFIKGAYGAKRQ